MVELKVDLSRYPERFENKQLILNENVNFIFGKNGTGKSTIKEAIKDQNESSKNIFIFDGFEKIIEGNESLNAIALGNDNVSIQKEINKIDAIIEKMNDEINPEKGDNLGLLQKTINEEYLKIIGDIETYNKAYAKEIKELSNLKLSKNNYDKNDFQEEKQYAKLLDEDEIKKLKEILRGEKMDIVQNYSYNTLNIQSFLDRVNIILLKSIDIRINIDDLDTNIDKQNFAKEGLKIHKHRKGEKCAFCGNIISEERRTLLQQYFNKEVNNLEKDIDNLIQEINAKILLISGEPELNKDLFYEHLRESVKNCNKTISSIKNHNILFLKNLIELLNNKKKNLFSKGEEVIPNNLPNDFSNIMNEINHLVDAHNDLSNNLESEQKQAADRIRYHEIAKLIQNKKYKELIAAEPIKKKEKDNIDKKVIDKRKEIEKLILEKSKLLENTKDEGKVVKYINNCLMNSGINSFKLKLFNSDNSEMKGQYKIEGYNGEIRNIDKLSKGEKNIIAFLYFFHLVTNPENQKGNKIIIFDDPMSSNDDRLQYLMTSKINEIYSNKYLKKGDIFLLLTHNIHFYLNVRPYNDNILGERYYEKNHYYKLQKDGFISKIIQIKSHKEDYKSNYDELRDDLKFLYNHDRKMAMINTCRRILETYKDFNCINTNDLYSGNEEAKKLFNVNSHGIYDLEGDTSGKTKDDIISLLEQVLYKNNGKNHFTLHFKLGQEQN